MGNVNLKKELRAIVYWLSLSYVILFTVMWPSLRIALSVQRDGRPLNPLEAKFGLVAIILQVLVLSMGYLSFIAKHYQNFRNPIEAVSAALLIPLLFYCLDTPFVLAVASSLGLYTGKVAWSLGEVMRALIPLVLLAISLWVAFCRRIGIKEAFQEESKKDGP